VPIAIDSLGLSPVRDIGVLLRYYRLLRRIRPDVFLGYTAKPNVYGSLAAQMLGIRVINNISGLGTAFIGGRLLRRIVSWLYRIALRRSAVGVLPESEDRDLFLDLGLVQPDQTRLLPGSGIDLARFTPEQRLPSTDGTFTFLLVGRLLRQKGVREFVEAARMVRRQFPDARFQLLGFLDAPNRSAIGRDEVAAWEAEGAVEYLGETDDVRPALGASDCVVLPSYREGLPRSLLEGAAMAKPLIATDVSGLPAGSRAWRQRPALRGGRCRVPCPTRCWKCSGSASRSNREWARRGAPEWSAISPRPGSSRPISRPSEKRSNRR
jgi:glycosyltransferase involved in cell wall biosynthesis